MLKRPRVVTWEQFPGNPFLTALKPEMLTSEGYKLTKVSKLKNESLDDKPELTTFIFDESYVYYLVWEKVITSLAIINFDDATKLLKKTFDYVRKHH